jgi:hypothetical protein
MLGSNIYDDENLLPDQIASGDELRHAFFYSPNSNTWRGLVSKTACFNSD